MTLMRSPLPSLIAQRLANGGHDAEACLSAFGLERALIETHVVAEVETLAAFYDDAAVRLEQPNLGLDLIDAIGRGAYGLAEFGIRAAPTIREAMRRLARFSVLLNEATVVEIEETEETFRVHQRIPGHPLSGGRHANEYFIAVLLAIGRTITSGVLVATEVWFSHPAPQDLSRHRTVFGTATLSFDQRDNGLAIHRSIADVPLESADPALMQAIDAQADRLLETRTTDDFLGHVREAMSRFLREGAPGLADIAKLLGMTPRTLQRRLAEHETSFREVLDGLRSDLHARLVAQGISSEEAAFRLGYADMGSFRRALRRWGG